MKGVFAIRGSLDQAAQAGTVAVAVAGRDFEAVEKTDLALAGREMTGPGQVEDISSWDVAPDFPANQAFAAFDIGLFRIGAGSLLLPICQTVAVWISPRTAGTNFLVIIKRVAALPGTPETVAERVVGRRFAGGDGGRGNCLQGEFDFGSIALGRRCGCDHDFPPDGDGFRPHGPKFEAPLHTRLKPCAPAAFVGISGRLRQLPTAVGIILNPKLGFISSRFWIRSRRVNGKGIVAAHWRGKHARHTDHGDVLTGGDRQPLHRQSFWFCCRILRTPALECRLGRKAFRYLTTPDLGGDFWIEILTHHDRNRDTEDTEKTARNEC
jgi:hypothetical protein